MMHSPVYLEKHIKTIYDRLRENVNVRAHAHEAISAQCFEFPSKSIDRSLLRFNHRATVALFLIIHAIYMSITRVHENVLTPQRQICSCVAR